MDKPVLVIMAAGAVMEVSSRLTQWMTKVILSWIFPCMMPGRQVLRK